MSQVNNPLYLKRFAPITTGTPQVASQTVKQQKKAGNTPDFQSVLQEQISREKELTFSKHAAARVEERNIDLSESNLARLQQGVRLAESKGLDDTLILVDNTAFIVSVKNSKVITTVGQDDLTGNVFTNIDGTVIV